MKTAGVMLDFYDDPTGSLMKVWYPTPESLPEIVKTAHILSPEERAVLRDDAYALVMHNEGQVFRKFACVDPGNTLLSLQYFEKTAELLPVEAREAAREALRARAIEFGLIETEKTAAKGLQRKRDPMAQPFAGDENEVAQRTNLRQVISGGGKVTDALGNLNTKTAARKPPPGLFNSAMAQGKKAIDWATPHTNKAMDAVKAHPGLTAGAVGAGIAAGRMSKNANVVDVSGKQEIRFVKQASETHALGHKFPLDSYADVRAAVDYFRQSWPEFQPPERHEFAVKVAARADAIGLEVPEVMARYGSTEYAPDVEAHLANRKANCGKEFHEVYDALKEKQAEIEPEHFAALLAKADVTAGLNWHWGGAVSDPWLSTFGGKSVTEKTAFGWEGGGYQVDAEKLQEAAASGVLKGNFTDDVVAAFEKDPVTIFSSMPDDTKLIMARLASE